jgi:hypothetical protein
VEDEEGGEGGICMRCDAGFLLLLLLSLRGEHIGEAEERGNGIEGVKANTDAAVLFP